MKGTNAEVAVTLPPALHARLAAEAAELNVPMEWIVAALVAELMYDRPSWHVVA
jgi:hypothetical protein